MTNRRLRLVHRVTTTPDSSPGLFFVEAGRDFDASGYARAFEVDAGDFDAADLVEVKAAAAKLAQGEWLRVTHESTGSK